MAAGYVYGRQASQILQEGEAGWGKTRPVRKDTQGAVRGPRRIAGLWAWTENLEMDRKCGWTENRHRVDRKWTDFFGGVDRKWTDFCLGVDRKWTELFFSDGPIFLSGWTANVPENLPGKVFWTFFFALGMAILRRGPKKK